MIDDRTLAAALAHWAINKGYHRQIGNGLRGVRVVFRPDGLPDMYQGDYLPADGVLRETWSGSGIRAVQCIPDGAVVHRMTVSATELAARMVAGWKIGMERNKAFYIFLMGGTNV
jgi:hypothetical protein